MHATVEPLYTRSGQRRLSFIEVSLTQRYNQVYLPSAIPRSVRLATATAAVGYIQVYIVKKIHRNQNHACIGMVMVKTNK